LCSTEYQQSDCELTRSLVSEKLRGNTWELRFFDSKGDRRPEIDLDDGERRLFDISCALTSGAWDWMADIVTVVDIATPR